MADIGMAPGKAPDEVRIETGGGTMSVRSGLGMVSLRPEAPPLPVDGSAPPVERVDLMGLAIDAFGTELAEACRSVAERDFLGLRAGLAALGRTTLDARSWRGLAHGRVEPTPLASVALCMRYPFLIKRDWKTDEVLPSREGDALPFASTELDAMPDGWQARFGLEMCEDLRAILLSSALGEDALWSYRIDQIKEKWGALTWYSHGEPADVADDVRRCVALYGRISQRVCVDCGSLLRVRQSPRGRVLQLCEGCRARDAELGADDVVDYLNSMHAADKEPLDVRDGRWLLPAPARRALMHEMLDAMSREVPSIASDSEMRVLTLPADGTGAVEESVDILGWAHERGLLAWRVASRIDGIRADVDAEADEADAAAYGAMWEGIEGALRAMRERDADRAAADAYDREWEDSMRRSAHRAAGGTGEGGAATDGTGEAE